MVAVALQPAPDIGAIDPSMPGHQYFRPQVYQPVNGINKILDTAVQVAKPGPQRIQGNVRSEYETLPRKNKTAVPGSVTGQVQDFELDPSGGNDLPAGDAFICGPRPVADSFQVLGTADRFGKTVETEGVQVIFT